MKVADFDNDGWVDIFNAEGDVCRVKFGFNTLIRNMEGKGFEQKQFYWNLGGDFGLFSFSLIDFDNDGDLDIIRNSAVDPIRVFENLLNDNNRIFFSISFLTGNKFGLNSKIWLYDNKGGRQMHEIKAGGGYQSFDDPRDYFGLGKDSAIESLRVDFTGCSSLVIKKTFKPGAHYQILLK